MQNPTKNKTPEIIPQKIAIYHTGALGDLLVSTAALYESIQLFPYAEFTVIGTPLWKELIVPKIWSNIHFILEVQNKTFTQLKLWRSNLAENKWIECSLPHSCIVSFLKNYQMTIDLRTESLRFAWRALLARVPVRVGGSKNKFSKLFFTHFTLEKSKKNIHERDRYLEVLLPLDKNKIENSLQFWSENGLPQLNENLFHPSERKMFLINPTASIREKAWPSEKFRQLALKLKEQNFEVAIIGSPKETNWLKEVASEDFKILQPQSIAELIQIVSQAKYLITNTSSMQFIAASTRTPTLTLMGLAEPHKWGPLGHWSRFVKGKQLKLKKSIFRPKKEDGKLNEVLSYNSISVDEILNRI
ncbi:MAG: glycosyltransferase family 9 protein [Bdellovibrionota bacterium]